MTRNHEDPLAQLGLRPRLGHDLPALQGWLFDKKLTDTGPIFDRPVNEYLPGAAVLGDRAILGQSTNRSGCRRRTQEQLVQLKSRLKKVTLDCSPERLWEAALDAEASVRRLNWERLPAEAIAFYRPFHFPPFDQWGIYILVEPLLSYHQQLVRQSKQLNLFAPQVLMHLILFEVFNHEFFHHLVESTATTLEILLATQGAAQPVYLRHCHQQAVNKFRHPHAPLEEALANAYAHNALSFVSRIKVGFKTASVKAYQKAIERHWPLEPAGYRDAGHYIRGDYIAGGAHLLAQLLDNPNSADQTPLSVVAKHVMPGGFTALLAKPDIPTWLVGSAAELALLNELVPAPNEAYTQLFWPYNTDDLDWFIEQKLAEAKAKKAAQKIARGSPSQ